MKKTLKIFIIIIVLILGVVFYKLGEMQGSKMREKQENVIVEEVK